MIKQSDTANSATRPASPPSIALVQRAFSCGDFNTALDLSNAAIDADQNNLHAVLMKAQTLIALNDVASCLDTFNIASQRFGSSGKILAIARNTLILYGRFIEGLEYAKKIAELDPDNAQNDVFIFQCLMATRDFSTIEKFFEEREPNLSAPIFKMKCHYEQFVRTKQRSPRFAAIWEATLADLPLANKGIEYFQERLPFIQYWSQGTPPQDVGSIVSTWNSLLEREGLGKIILFNRISATQWIDSFAPEFSAHFAKAFHYAMESDIFRLAYASRRSCIYMDIDSWPLAGTANILRAGVASGSSMLYFRSHRPWLVNGYFISRVGCPFFKRLISQCLDQDLDKMPKNHITIDSSFGPGRFNKVLHNMLSEYSDTSISNTSIALGCATIALGDKNISFTHDAAVAAVKPPFALGYKTTADYWKGVSL